MLPDMQAPVSDFEAVDAPPRCAWTPEHTNKVGFKPSSPPEDMLVLQAPQCPCPDIRMCIPEELHKQLQRFCRTCKHSAVLCCAWVWQDRFSKELPCR